MDIVKSSIYGLASTMLTCSLASAANFGSPAVFQGFRPVVTLQGGYASINADNGTQRFTGTDSNMFTYSNSGSGRDTGFIGVFLGAEHPLPWLSHYSPFMEAGVEYNYFSNVSVPGINTVGIEPQSSTTYQYNYHLQTQQVLGTFKLFATVYERYYLYGEAGLGAAINRIEQYQATTRETGSLNLTPVFSSHDNTQFSYSLGLGVGAQVNKAIRVGLGYRYSNFGSSTFGGGTVAINQYQSPAPFSLGSSNTYANQLIASISYVA